MDNTVNSSALTFTFSGGIEVDALTVADTIRNLVSISTDTTKSEYPGTTLSLSIRAPKQGSLMFDFVVLAVQKAQSLVPGAIQTAKSVVDIIVAMFQIKQFLKGSLGETEKSGNDNIKIKRHDGSEITVPKGAVIIFTDASIDSAINKILECADKSNGVTGVTVSSSNRSISIPREEFSECRLTPAASKQSLTITRRNEILYVKSAEFQGNAQWKFVSDRTVVADIQDTGFLERIHAGEVSINAKTYLVADVLLTIPLKADGTPDESKVKYSVIKVHSVTSPDDKNQIEL